MSQKYCKEQLLLFEFASVKETLTMNNIAFNIIENFDKSLSLSPYNKTWESKNLGHEPITN